MANSRRPMRALSLSRRSVLLLLTIVSVFVLCNLVMYHELYHSKISKREAIEHQKSAAIVFTLYSKYPTLAASEESPSKCLTRTLLDRDSKRLKSKAATISADDAASALYKVDGNVCPDGLYYAAVRVGEPPKVYFLDMDTGSELTWLNCDAPCQNCALGPNGLYNAVDANKVDCLDELCFEIQLNSVPVASEKEAYDECKQCDYYVEYGDASSTKGYLISELLTLHLSDGREVQTAATIGCGYDQGGKRLRFPAISDGMMGLSKNKVALPSQLAKSGIVTNVIGQCLGSDGGNYLFFGEALVPSSGMMWVPMVDGPHELVRFGFYIARIRSIWYGADELDKGDAIDEIMFDSGTTYSYFAPKLYNAVLSAVHSKARRWGLEMDWHDDFDLGLPTFCSGGKLKFKSVSDAHQYFQTVTLDFGGGSVLELRPEAYLFTPGNGHVCFGILQARKVGTVYPNMIGDISMRGYLFVFHNVRDEIGWVRKDCNNWGAGSP